MKKEMEDKKPLAFPIGEELLPSCLIINPDYWKGNPFPARKEKNRGLEVLLSDDRKKITEFIDRYTFPEDSFFGFNPDHWLDYPIKAAQHIKIKDITPPKPNDALGNVSQAILKLEAVKKNLEPEFGKPKNKKKRQFINGLLENLKGSLPFLDRPLNKSRRAFLKTVASGLLVVTLATACNDVVPTIQTEPIPIVETAVFTETAEPTPVPTPFPKLKVTETSPNAGGSYSTEQLAVIDSEGFEEKVGVINNWWSYWGNAGKDQRPFHPESKNIHIVPFFEEENPESYSLAIEAKMDDGNWHTFLLPIDISKSEFRQYPPVEFGSNGIPLKTGYDIPEGFGPLEVTGDIRWTESFGWVRFDESGEMVEAINMETGQWEKIESVKFSEKYPVTWHEGYIAKVGEMEIPIDIGLHYKIRLRTEEPISEIHIAPDMVDGVGDYFMHMCFWRYTQLMDHPDVTYEQYLELVAKGEGKVEILTYDEDKPDQKYSEKNLIDPRKGFSFVMAGEVLPMGSNGGYYLGSSKEKILLAIYIPTSYLVMAKASPYPDIVCVNLSLGYSLVDALSYAGFLRVEYDRSSMPAKFREWQHSYLRLEMDKYLYGSRLDPPFSTLQP